MAGFFKWNYAFFNSNLFIDLSQKSEIRVRQPKSLKIRNIILDYYYVIIDKIIRYWIF